MFDKPRNNEHKRTIKRITRWTEILESVEILFPKIEHLLESVFGQFISSKMLDERFTKLNLIEFKQRIYIY